MPRSPYLRTDEQEEAVRSLERAELQARAVTADPYAWKWVLIALHNAAQGFMVLALWNGNGLLALRPKIAKKWIEAYERGGPYPAEKLDDFLSLYAKIKERTSFHTFGADPFVATERHNRSMVQLNEFRNTFTHFTPKGWPLELAGLPRICLDALELMNSIGLQSTAVLWYRPSRRQRAEKALKRMTKTLLRLKAQ
jgi:hypothetical protein